MTRWQAKCFCYGSGWMVTRQQAEVLLCFRVDGDQDGKLSVAELEGWVMSKMEEHFAEATQENEEIFKHLDPDNNGIHIVANINLLSLCLCLSLPLSLSLH